MIDDLYSKQILKLVANIPRTGQLDTPDGTGECVAKLCGSRVRVDVCVGDGRVTQFAQNVKACALGQACASILGAVVIGATIDEIQAGRDALHAMLTDGPPPPGGRFIDLAILACVRDYPQRHASTLLPFDATLAAIADVKP